MFEVKKLNVMISTVYVIGTENKVMVKGATRERSNRRQHT
jgi:hypothetical protein